MTDCNGCGACCDPVVLPYTQLQAQMAQDDEIDPDDRRFVLEDLTPITRRQGLLRSPYLTNGGLTIYGNEDTGQDYWFWSLFYECRHFDKVTRRCGNYENRPPICRGYPWYGEPPDNLKNLPADCSYRADQTGVGVTIADKVTGRRIG